MKSPSRIELRVPLSLVEPLQTAVRRAAKYEPVVFGLTSHATLRQKTVLLLKKILPLPDEDYIAGTRHGAAWAGRAMIPMLNEAMRAGLGVVIFHAHQHSGGVSLSNDDRESATKLLPSLQNLVRSRPHASVVLGDDHSAGMVLLPNQDTFEECTTVRCIGKTLIDLPSQDDCTQTRADEIHHRQALLTGATGEQRLKQATIGVVGLSGGGSHVVQQLAHLGIGRIFGIDGERVETSNRGRLIGMGAFDGFFRRKKIALMRRLVRRINRKVEFVGIGAHLPRQAAIDAVKECDVVVGCLDNYHARSDLQELAWRYLIPYVHIGMLIRPDPRTGHITIGGDIATLIPGAFCMWCIDLLSKARLNAETDGRPRCYFEGTDKQAQVVSFNGSLASQAVTEVLQLLTGFAPKTNEFSIKKFNGLEGTIIEWEVKQKPDCSCCVNTLGSGEPVWQKI